MLEPMLVGDFDGVVSRSFAFSTYASAGVRADQVRVLMMRLGRVDLQETVQEVCSWPEGLVPVPADVSPYPRPFLSPHQLPSTRCPAHTHPSFTLVR